MEQLRRVFKNDVQRSLNVCGPPLSFKQILATLEYTACNRKKMDINRCWGYENEILIVEITA